MGRMRHDAILVTSWNREAIEAAEAKALDIGLRVIGPSDPATNDYSTMLVCPDGSKEGWPESNDGDARRSAFLAYLGGVRYSDNSSCLEWVALAYGNDDCSAQITAHVWEVPLVGEAMADE